MSIEAMNWVLNDAPEVPASLAMTLMGLANHAGPDGRGAYPKVKTLARYARKTERSIAWDLDDLLDLGLIRMGEQELVDHLPEGKRPKVYTLALEKRRDPNKPEKLAQRKGRKASRERTAQKKAEEAAATPDAEDTPVPGDTSPDDLTCPQGHPTPVPGDTPTPVPGDVSDLSPGTPPLIRNEPPLNRPVEPSFEPSMAREHAETHTADDDGQTSLLPDEPPAAPPVPTPKPKRPRRTKAEQAARATRMPEDFALTDGRRNYAIKKGVPPAAVEDMFEHFKNHHIGKGTRWEVWDRAWITWVLNSPRFGGSRSGGQQARPVSAAAERQAGWAELRADLAAKNGTTPPPNADPYTQTSVFPFPADKIVEGRTA
ncbi:hypothetical protein MXD62_19640 [Frankia sp. Mgl5]|uniref:hypothetical protein n=1 Tax=Frankia sp. Mgl5 TaxID=2933793 RepID=UPI0020102C03|nr:hypothetical protein [Frankia sp. Mgl5]MCK9929366.1 hypothetical protein [Frankia sp. Mgl5]